MIRSPFLLFTLLLSFLLFSYVHCYVEVWVPDPSDVYVGGSISSISASSTSSSISDSSVVFAAASYPVNSPGGYITSVQYNTSNLNDFYFQVWTPVADPDNVGYIKLQVIASIHIFPPQIGFSTRQIKSDILVMPGDRWGFTTGGGPAGILSTTSTTKTVDLYTPGSLVLGDFVTVLQLLSSDQQRNFALGFTLSTTQPSTLQPTASYTVGVSSKVSGNPYFGVGSPYQFTLNSSPAPSLTINRGTVVTFTAASSISVGAPHLFTIMTDANGGVTQTIVSGSTKELASNGDTFKWQADPLGYGNVRVYYQCENHLNMGNYILVVDPVPDVNCEYSYSAYSACSQTCGSGVQVSTLTISVAASGNGTACPTQFTLTQPCNTPACPVIPTLDVEVDVKTKVTGDPFYGTGHSLEFTVNGVAAPVLRIDRGTIVTFTSAPSFPSGHSFTVMTNQFGNVVSTVLTDSPTALQGPSQLIQWIADPTGSGTATFYYQCQVHTFMGNSIIVNDPVAPVDCVYSYSAYSACTRACNGGNQTSYLTITTPAAGAGAACPAGDITRSCNTSPCSTLCPALSDSFGTWSNTRNAGTYNNLTCERGYGNRGPANSSYYCVPGDVPAYSGSQPTCTLNNAFTVGVAAKTVSSPFYNQGSTNQFMLNGYEAPELVILRGTTVVFTGDSTMSSTHPFTIMTSATGGSVTTVLTGTTTITAPNGQITWVADPSGSGDAVFYFNCQAHTYMGNKITVRDPYVPPVDCVSSYSAYGACSRQCGNGTQIATLIVTTPAAGTGTPCPAASISRACNTQPCFGFCSDLTDLYGSWSNGVSAGSDNTLTCPIGYGANGGLRVVTWSCQVDDVPYYSPATKPTCKLNDYFVVDIVTKQEGDPFFNAGEEVEFTLNGLPAPAITVIRGVSVKFVGGSTFNAAHSFTVMDADYDTGAFTVTVLTSSPTTITGAGQQITWVADPNGLGNVNYYYQCQFHYYMGNRITVVDVPAFTGTTNATYNSSNTQPAPTGYSWVLNSNTPCITPTTACGALGSQIAECMDANYQVYADSFCAGKVKPASVACSQQFQGCTLQWQLVTSGFDFPPTSRFQYCSSNSSIYVMGGINSGTVSDNAVQVTSSNGGFVTNTLPKMPPVPVYDGSLTCGDGLFILLNGKAGTKRWFVNASREAFGRLQHTRNTTFTSTWQKQNIVYKARSGAAYVPISSTFTYVLGGQTKYNYTNDVWTVNWHDFSEKLIPAPYFTDQGIGPFSPRVGAAAGFLTRSSDNPKLHGKVVLVGGLNYTGFALNDIYILDLDTLGFGAWEDPLDVQAAFTAPTPFAPRAYAAYTSVNDYFYIVGGVDPMKGLVFNDVYRLTRYLVWETLTPTNRLFSPRFGAGLSILNNFMYVYGGAVTVGSDLSTATAVNDVWVAPVPLTTPVKQTFQTFSAVSFKDDL